MHVFFFSFCLLPTPLETDTLHPHVLNIYYFHILLPHPNHTTYPNFTLRIWWGSNPWWRYLNTTYKSGFILLNKTLLALLNPAYGVFLFTAYSDTQLLLIANLYSSHFLLIVANPTPVLSYNLCHIRCLAKLSLFSPLLRCNYELFRPDLYVLCCPSCCLSSSHFLLSVRCVKSLYVCEQYLSVLSHTSIVFSVCILILCGYFSRSNPRIFWAVWFLSFYKLCLSSPTLSLRMLISLDFHPTHYPYPHPPIPATKHSDSFMPLLLSRCPAPNPMPRPRPAHRGGPSDLWPVCGAADYTWEVP